MLCLSTSIKPNHIRYFSRKVIMAILIVNLQTTCGSIHGPNGHGMASLDPVIIVETDDLQPPSSTAWSFNAFEHESVSQRLDLEKGPLDEPNWLALCDGRKEDDDEHYVTSCKFAGFSRSVRQRANIVNFTLVLPSP